MESTSKGIKFDTRENPPVGRRKKLVTLLSALFLFTGIASPDAQGALNCSEKSVPAGLPIPPGMHVEDCVRGDLSGDGLNDFALILDPDRDNHESDTTILVLLQKEDGSFEKVGSNEKLSLPDYGPSGGMGISIEKKGVLVIDVLVGSRSGSQGIWRFRLDPKRRRMRLIGFDMLGYDVDGSGTTESTNYLTGRRVTEAWIYSEKKQARVVTRSQTTSVATPRTFLEEVTSEPLN